MRISAENLTKICIKILRAVGASNEEANIVANQLIEANLRGQDGHGILLLQGYARRLRRVE